MDFSIATCIKKNVDRGKVEQFVYSLSKTSYPFHFFVVNNSDFDLNPIIKKYGIENYYEIRNAIDVNPVTCINQVLYNTMDLSEYTVYVNSSDSLVVNEDWLKGLLRYRSENFGIGGTVFPLKISNSPEMLKIIQSSSADGIDWLSKKVNRYMMVNCVDSNIFMIKNKNLKISSLPDMKSCTESSYGVEMSFRFLSNDFAIINIEEINSSSKDNFRFDIGDAIRKGAKIICPVVSSSVRERIIF